MSQEQIFHKFNNNILATFTEIYDGVDEESAQLLRDLKKARKGSLDDKTVNSTQKHYTERLLYLEAGEKQFKKWLCEETLMENQKFEINRILSIIEKTRIINHEILDLCKHLEKITIEKLMSKSDFELAMDFLQK